MQAVVATTYDPFHPQRGRDVRAIAAPVRLADLAPLTDRPFVCLRNGQAVLRRDWNEYVADGDLIAFVTLPQGGGDGGSNPLSFILMIAVVIFAPYMAPTLASGLGISVGVAQAGIVAVGSMLVNALVPPPKMPSTQSAASLAAPSPTYSLQAQGNYARLEAAIPVQYGRVKLLPDFGAQPYAEYQGNEQFLYQLFVIGQGEFEIESINIEDTPITSWDDISYEVIAPYGTLTLFPANVVTSVEVSGQELTNAGYTGPFVANASGTDANALGIDIILSRGLYHYNTVSGAVESDSLGFTIEAQEIDDAGAAIGAWVTLETVTLTAATTTPQRYSYRYPVTAARYQVRMIRTDAKLSGSEYGNDLLWGGLRAYLPDVRDFGNVTLLAMRMRASNNLSLQASRKINVIATRKLLSWNPSTGWSAATASSRSIAWAIADALRASYGGKLADARINLQHLYDLDAIWAARGDHFDGRFDNSLTLWEAVSQIAQAGRAKPYIQGGIVNVARDADQPFPVALFSMRNIVSGSFSVDYILPSDDTADAVEASYVDAATWTPQKVTAALPGSAAAQPARISLFGVTGREHAYRESMYQAASNRYRRKIIRFSTEMEGFIPSFGDLIAVQHDMPQWGQHAEVTDVTSVTNYSINSQTIGSTGWSLNNAPTITANADTAPDGTATATRIQSSAYASGTYIASFYPWVGVTYNWSVYVKDNGGANKMLMLGIGQGAFGSSGGDHYVLFDLSTGAFSSVNPVFTQTIAQALDDGWWRVSLQFTTTAPMSLASEFVYGYTSGVDFLAWGTQWTVGGDPTYYVKTSASIRTATAFALSEPPVWQTSGTHYVGARRKDGSIDGPLAVTWAGAQAVAFIDEPDFGANSTADYERTQATFGWGDTWRQEARVTSIRPRGLYQVEIEAINEDPSVHTADEGLTAPAVVSSQLTTLYTAPVVLGLTGASLPGDPTVMLLSWQQAAGADHYLIDQSQDSSDWTRVAETRAANYSGRALYGAATIVRIAAVGLTRGPWVQWYYGLSSDYMWDAVSSTLMWDADPATLMWRY